MSLLSCFSSQSSCCLTVEENGSLRLKVWCFPIGYICWRSQEVHHTAVWVLISSTTFLIEIWTALLRIRINWLCVYIYIYNAVSWCFSLIAMVTLSRVHWEKPTARAVEMCSKWLLHRFIKWKMKPESVHVPFKFEWICHPKSWITGVFSQNLTKSREFHKSWSWVRRNLELAPVKDATLHHLKRFLGLSQAVQDLPNHQQNISVLGFLWVHKIRQQFPSNSHKTPVYAKWGLQACYVQKFLHNIQMAYVCSININIYIESILIYINTISTVYKWYSGTNLYSVLHNAWKFHSPSMLALQESTRTEAPLGKLQVVSNVDMDLGYHFQTKLMAKEEITHPCKPCDGRNPKQPPGI